MRISDEVLLRIYMKQGKSFEEAQATLKRVRATHVDPGLTPPCFDNAADDSYFVNRVDS